jgi:hypothetical protein
MLLRTDCDKMEYKKDLQIKKILWCLKNECLRYVSMYTFVYVFACTHIYI